MDEFISIFKESTEDMGIMFNSYKPILDITENFLDSIEDCIESLNENPSGVDIDITDEISKFKEDTSIDFQPESIDIYKMRFYLHDINDFKSRLERLLDRFVKMKNKTAYGGNYLRAIINKPKVYSRDIDPEAYERINNNIRNVARAMDWIEKVMIDLFNMADQDINILNIINRVYVKQHIYETQDEIETEDVADSVAPQLPQAGTEEDGTVSSPVEDIEEVGGTWHVRTMNKKTGGMPLYISRNHDMYDDETDTDDHSMDDFKRPSSRFDDDDDDDPDPRDHSSFDKKDDVPTSTTSPATNNYYYYTYNNSLNQNKGSFNKDHSTHDDHSYHTRKDDHSVRDDHSKFKRTNSDNIYKHNDDDEEYEYRALESAEDFSDFEHPNGDNEEKKKVDMKEFTLNIIPPSPKTFMEQIDELITEGVKSDWNKECKIFQQLYHYDLNKLGDINSPPKKITLNLDGKKMVFRVGRGYSQSNGRRVDRYAQVPTSIHTFNVYKNKFIDDKIGIANGVLHQLKMMDRKFDKKMTFAQAVKVYDIQPCRLIFKQCGEIGLTFKTNIKDQIIGINIEPDLTVHDGEEEIAYECVDILNEGVFDSIKKGIKTLFRKVNNFIRLKKSLANLQSLDNPKIINTRVPLTIIGTDIPIGRNGLSQTTSNTIHESSDLEFLMENGYYISEDAQVGNLSKNDIKNIINRLKKKFNAEIIFIHGSSNLSIQVGPASVIRTTREDIIKIMKGKTMTEINSQFNIDDPSLLNTVIIVNPKMIESFGIKTPDGVEMIISHEYGHVLTFDQITDQDWMEYNIKRSLIASLAQFIESKTGNKYMHEANYQYYQLKPEKLANEAVNIDPKKLTLLLLKTRPNGVIPGLDCDKIINWKPSGSIMDMNRLSLEGKTPDKASMMESLKESEELYKNWVTDNNILTGLIDALHYTMDFCQNHYTESFLIESSDDPDKPESDHPIRDALMDIDQKTTKLQQGAKKKVQEVQNAGKAFMKPINRTGQWVSKMVHEWRDLDETKLKEKIADPYARKGLFNAIRTAIKYGSLAKAGLLMNPLFLFLAGYRKYTVNANKDRLRNEMMGELEAEIEIINEKISDAKHDKKAKYRLMRFKNELEKKKLRVGGGKKVSKVL